MQLKQETNHLYSCTKNSRKCFMNCQEIFDSCSEEVKSLIEWERVCEKDCKFRNKWNTLLIKE